MRRGEPEHLLGDLVTLRGNENPRLVLVHAIHARRPLDPLREMESVSCRNA